MASALSDHMSENDLKAWVIDLAKLRGWKVVHFRPAKTDKGWRTPVEGDRGFPDLVLARRGRVIFAELKAGRGKMTADQEDWGIHLGPHFVLWRPEDRPDIERILTS